MNPKLFKLIQRGACIFLLPVMLAFPKNISVVRAAPGDITRLSVDSAGTQANGNSRRANISGDGRFVAFESDAANLADGAGGLFLKDRQNGAVTRISVDGENPSVSNDGRFVVFESFAATLVSEDTNGVYDVFIYDRQSEVTTRVSVDSAGVQANGQSTNPSISGDGRFVAFQSDAANLVNGDENGVSDIFVHDNQTGTTERISRTSDGAGANARSFDPSISSDASVVTFTSNATNLNGNDTNNKPDIFARNRMNGATTRISINSSGFEADGGSGSSAISGDGRYVVFLSDSGNLDPRANDYRGKQLVYMHDRQIGQTTLASVYSDGTILTVGLLDQPTISKDGRYVAFSFYDKGNNNGIMNIWVRDLQTSSSISVTGGNASSGEPSLSADGKVVAFDSSASNLVGGDTNGTTDVFAREVSYGPEHNPSVASVTPDCGFSTPQCSYPSHASVSFIVIFSEPVAGVTADDFSLDMLEGITGASITGVSGSGVEYFVTVATGAGDGKLRLNVIDNDSITDSTLNPLGGVGTGNGNFTTGKTYQIDKSSFLTVTSIVRADPSPSNAATVRFTIAFSEVVYPVNLSDFVLSTTGSVSGASIMAIDPREDQFTPAATYTVTVNTGTGDGTLRLDLIDDDSILDNISSTPLGGVGAGNGNFSTGETYTINKSTSNIPSVISVLRIDQNPSTGGILHFAVNFSGSVTGVDAIDFLPITTGSIAGAVVTEVSGSGNTYTVAVNAGTGDDTLRLDVLDNDSILNALNVPLGGVGVGNGNFTSGEVYSINGPAPSIISILRTDAHPTAATVVHFNVTFSEAVSGVDGSDFLLTANGISNAGITEFIASGNTYFVTVNTGIGNGTIRLDVVDNDSIVDIAGYPLGGAGMGNGNFNIGETYTITKITYISMSEKLRSTGENDGWVLEAGEDSAVGGSKNSTAATFILGDDARDRQYRSILHFPTFYLPDNAVITSAILTIKAQGLAGTDPFTTHGNISVDIRYGPFGFFGPFGIKALQISDFQADSSLNSVAMIENNPVGGWYWTPLNSSSFQYISLTGITQLRLAFQLDTNNDLGNDTLLFYSGDYVDQRYRPHLLIEYLLPR